MPNTPSNFPYLVGTDPDQPEERTGGPDQSPSPGNLPLPIDGAIRYWPLYDNTDHKVKMRKSTDNGQTWAPLNNAGAPTLVTDGSGGGTVQIYEYFNAAYSPFDKKIYLVTFNSSFNLTLIPFNTLTDLWEAAIDSSIGYLPTPNTSTRGVTGMMIAARPTDGAIWIGFMAGNGGTVPGTVDTDYVSRYVAKCVPGGAGWDGAVTRLGGTDFDGCLYEQGASMACDAATGDIHCIYVRTIQGIGALFSSGHTINQGGAGYPLPNFTTVGRVWNTATAGDPAAGGAIVSFTGPDGSGTPTDVPTVAGPPSVVHRVIKADDTLAPEDTVFADSVVRDISISNLKVGDGVMSFCMLTGGNSFALGQVARVARAVIADTPSWEVTAPAAVNTTPDISAQMFETARVNGKDRAFYGYSNALGTVSYYSYVESDGIGSPWGSEVNFAQVDNATGPVFYGTLILSPQLPNAGGWAIGLAAGSDWGMGYWEPGASPPPAAVRWLPQYVKPLRLRA